MKNTLVNILRKSFFVSSMVFYSFFNNGCDEKKENYYLPSDISVTQIQEFASIKELGGSSEFRQEINVPTYIDESGNEVPRNINIKSVYLKYKYGNLENILNMQNISTDPKKKIFVVDFNSPEGAGYYETEQGLVVQGKNGDIIKKKKGNIHSDKNNDNKIKENNGKINETLVFREEDLREIILNLALKYSYITLETEQKTKQLLSDIKNIESLTENIPSIYITDSIIKMHYKTNNISYSEDDKGIRWKNLVINLPNSNDKLNNGYSKNHLNDLLNNYLLANLSKNVLFNHLKEGGLKRKDLDDTGLLVYDETKFHYEPVDFETEFFWSESYRAKPDMMVEMHRDGKDKLVSVFFNPSQDILDKIEYEEYGWDNLNGQNNEPTYHRLHYAFAANNIKQIFIKFLYERYHWED